MAAEVERQLLNHYKLDSLYPAEWPARDDESDASDDESLLPNGSSSTKSKSKYAGLDRRASLRSSMSMSAGQKPAGGADSLVQKDEPDPLGIAPSVVQQLRRRRLPVEDNLKLRNRFMLSSTTFSPTLFLSQVHHDASTDSLLHGLDFLSRSIEKKSASLKILVESNFERFVRAKATIDNVYQEMRTQGQDPSPQTPAHRRAHSRQLSKANAHFLSASPTTTSTTPAVAAGAVADKKKNALTKESEYGVLGIKAPLIELAVKAEEVWGPALGGRDKEEVLKSVLSYIEQNRSVFKIAANLQEAIKKRDYDTLVEEYSRAKRLSDHARALADDAAAAAAAENDPPLTDAQIHQIVVAAKIWHDTLNQLKIFKRDAWSRLSNAHTYRDAQKTDDQRDAHITLIATLLQLDVDENPIWFYLHSRYNQLKLKFNASFDRMRIQVEVARRKLASQPEPTLQVAKVHLQSATAHLKQDRLNNMDTPKVLDFWDKVQSALASLLAVQGGLLGEILDFWDTANSFISGRAQRNLPSAVFSSDAARHHLQLADDEIARLHDFAAELINLVREAIFSFFTEPPIEDISLLFSPVLDTPVTPGSALSPNQLSRKFSFDPSNIPPPSPQRGDAWEKYAFWPPHANSLSGAHYLGRMLTLVGTAASEVAGLALVKKNPKLLDQQKTLVVSVRERCVQAVCAAWNSDSDTCKMLEDWSRYPERRDLTNMPLHFLAFQETLLQNMQRILFISEAVQRPNSANVIIPPSSKLLSVVRHQFVGSMYKALSGTVENAERLKDRPDGSSQTDPDGIAVPAAAGIKIDNGVTVAESTDRVSSTHCAPTHTSLTCHTN